MRSLTGVKVLPTAVDTDRTHSSTQQHTAAKAPLRAHSSTQLHTGRAAHPLAPRPPPPPLLESQGSGGPHHRTPQRAPAAAVSEVCHRGGPLHGSRATHTHTQGEINRISCVKYIYICINYFYICIYCILYLCVHVCMCFACIYACIYLQLIHPQI
jgi:hypothetical protein